MNIRSSKTLTAVFLAGAAVGIQSASAAPVSPIEEVVVTGTRAQGRTELQSAVPISVYDSGSLQQSGFVDLGRALEAVAPSINFPHSETTPSAANTRTITLKGMAPDQLLVLIDGKRWHTSSVLNFNNAVGRGSAPYDLGVIPEGAIARIEVLRDGSAAQYGSDAIAGVVNIILKSSAHGLDAAGQAGITDKGDGANWDLTATKGLSIGKDGFLTLTGDVRYAEPTNRAGIDHRVGRVTYRIGDPLDTDVSLAANAGLPLGNHWQAYATLMGARRDVTNTGAFYTPGSSPIYPNGYLPHINPIIWDGTVITGAKGPVGAGIRADLSNSFGYTKADFTVNDTANPSLGTASPTSFAAGAEEYLENTTDLTLTRPIEHVLAGGNLAAGLEYRYEAYAIDKGSAASTTGVGSSGFPGFNPRLPVDVNRTAFSAFVDTELDPFKGMLLGAAGRYDNYSDFGDALTWKFSARDDLTDWLALRGSVSTGFRAPSLQQQYFSSVIAGLQALPGGGTQLVNVGTYQVADPIAAALGATALKPETSHNYSAGVVLQPFENFAFTADWFKILVANRIALSDRLSGPTVAAILAAHGITNVQQVQFFTNAANTTTEGFELTGSYQTELPRDISLALNAQYGLYQTAITRLAVDPVIPSISLLGTTSRYLLVSGQPQNKIVASATLARHGYSLTFSSERYGHWTSAPIGVPQTFSGKTLFDLTGTVPLTAEIDVTAGILNIGDVYPDRLAGVPVHAIGFTYGEESPFGVDGRSYFVRLAIHD